MFKLQFPQTILVTIISLVFSISISADVPNLINYQGMLTNPDDTPVEDNDYQIKFKIYGSEDGEDSLWSSGFQEVSVSGGYFNYVIGSNMTIPEWMFDSRDRYLGITVDTDQEIRRRTQLYGPEGLQIEHQTSREHKFESRPTRHFLSR